MDMGDDFLGGEIAGNSLPKNPEKISLFDVFFPIQNRSAGHELDLTAELDNGEVFRTGRRD